MFGRVAFPIVTLLALAPGVAAVQPDVEENAIWNEKTQFPQTCGDWDDWDKPADPFRVFGNTYYVGTCGITALAVFTDDGIIVLDSGTETGAEIVARNIGRIGGDLSQVKWLLTSHEHHDHVGGMARLQEATGAPVMTSVAAAEVLRSGRAVAADPQFGMHEPMQPVADVRTLGATGVVTLGGTTITAVPTPGHTFGALSWQWEACESSDCRTIVYADSLTPVSRDDYRFGDHPEVVADFRQSIRRVSELDCDILLTPHPSASGMREKLLADDLTSGTHCRDYAASLARRLNARLEQEAAGG